MGDRDAVPTTGPAAPRAWWRRQWPLGLVLAVVLAGLVLTGLGYVRRGPVLIGTGALLAAGLRLLLPGGDAGLLAVRRRAVDVGVLAVLGLATIVLALAVVPLPRR